MNNKKDQQYPRFSSVDRFQHWLMVASFSFLALTGLVQKFSNLSISIGFISLLGGIESVRVIHRIAATILMLEVVFHLGVVGYQVFVHRNIPKMMPKTKDISDAWKAFRFNLGMGKARPLFGRYSFEEKFEYWALVWGLAIMIVTGFMLWNPIATTQVLPGEFIPAAKSAHGNEALLALLAVLIWHLYHVLIRHFNRSMFRGTLSKGEMLEFHPVELAEIESKHQSPQTPEAIIAKRRLPYLLGYGVIAVLLLLGIFQFVTFEKTALDTIDPVAQVTTDEPPTLQPSPEPTPADESETQGNQALNLMWPLGAHSSQGGISFNYWDSQGQVNQECSTCHTSEGLPDFLSTGLTAPQPASGGLFCTTCHNDPSTFTIHDISSVVFPNGASPLDLTAESNLCISCHMGSASGGEIDNATVGLDNDAMNANLEFIDIHGATPGATMYGNDAQGAYQYADRSYFGLRLHTSDFGNCSDCHDPHLLFVDATTCEDCHSSFDAGQPFTSIRFSRIDYDGDGDINEGIGEEIESLQGYLYLSLQEYAAENSGLRIVYSAETAPYFFVDLNENGVIDEDETKLENSFTGWTPRLSKAAYNFHYAVLDSGGFAHHPKYIIQILYDSMESLGADLSQLTRP